MRSILLWSLTSLLALGAGSACGEDGVVLPANYNSGRSIDILIKPNDKLEPPFNEVRSLNGINGSSLPIVGDTDLEQSYGVKEKNSKEQDGAHLRMVRLGTDTVCDVSLETIFPDATADRNDPASYDFKALDQHVRAIRDLKTAQVLLQLGFNPGRGGECSATQDGVQLGLKIETEAEGDLWADVAINVLRHLRDGSDWDKSGGQSFGTRYVEFLDDPIGRMNYPTRASDPLYSRLFNVYADFAKNTKIRWPDDPEDGPVVRVGGISFEFTDPDQLDFESEDNKHPLLAFIDFCANNDVPLDFVSFKTRTLRPYDAFLVAKALREYLDGHGALQETELICTGMAIVVEDENLVRREVTGEDARSKAYIGAYETAARVYFQDVPVEHMIAGRGPMIFSDLDDHAGEDPNQIASLVVPSEYFEPDGEPTPAFMALFPFRQVRGHQRVSVVDGPDGDGLAVLASHDDKSDRKLHVIVANANVLLGYADIAYDLRLEGWVPASVGQVTYRLAVLDRNSFGLGSFHFSETGVLETAELLGTLRLVKRMAIPSIHYIEFEKPSAF